MKTLKGHLEGKLRDDRFRRLFAEESSWPSFRCKSFRSGSTLVCLSRRSRKKQKLRSSSYPSWSMEPIAMFRRFSRCATPWA